MQSIVSPKVPVPQSDESIVSDTTTGEVIKILRKPDVQRVSDQLDELKSKGINSIAIAFVHSYLWGEHEEMVAKIAEEKGFDVSVSSKLQPMVCFFCNCQICKLTRSIDQACGQSQLVDRRFLLDSGDKTIHRILWLRL